MTFSADYDILLLTELDLVLGNGNCSLLTFSQSETLSLFLSMYLILLEFMSFHCHLWIIGVDCSTVIISFTKLFSHLYYDIIRKVLMLIY